MGIKQVIDRNPIIALAGACVAVGSVIAGIMVYFADQKISAMEEREKAQILQLSAKHTAELSDLSSSLKEKIADLSFKLTSIQRSIPGTEPAYVDISKTVIGAEAVKALPSPYKVFWNGEFYLNAPQLGNWSSSTTNELEMNRLTYGETLLEGVPKSLTAIMEDSKILVWRRNESMAVKTLFEGHDVTLNFYPMVYIQKLGKLDIDKRMSALLKTIDDADVDGKDQKRDRAAETIEKIDRDSNESPVHAGENPPDKNSNQDASASSDAAQKIKSDIAKSKRQAEAKEKKVEELAAIYAADLASYVMFDALAGKMMQSQLFSGSTYKVFSAQKKANVFYIQAQESFPVRSSDSKTDPGSRLVINEEIFYFSMGQNGLLIKVFLPEIDGRGEDAAWVRSWLAGLQIPLNL